MKRLIFSIAMVPAVLVGCNDSGGNSAGSDSLGAPSFVINASNRSKVDQTAGSYAAESSSNTFLDSGDNRSLRSSPTFVTDQLRQVTSRATGTWEAECTSGSGTNTGTVTGIDEDTGEIEASGSISAESTYEDCKLESSTGYYFLQDGTVNMDIEWSGYSAASETFESLSVSVGFETYYSQEVAAGDTVAESTIDGRLTQSANSTEYRASFDISMSAPEIDNKVIAMETTSDIVQGVSDTYPTSGAFIVHGGEGTQAVYTIVANGIEVSLNGEQAELITWAEIEAGE